MEQRNVIITGANSGIGKAAAKMFASNGYTVIMACRNIHRSKTVQKEIIEETHNQRVDLMELDISSFQSIYSFCEGYKNRYDHLDILIHNAAYFNHGEKYKQSVDGIELTFATNVFGPFLMTQLLLDPLKKSKDARILNAGSNIIKHYFDPKRKMEYDQLLNESKDSSFSVYKMYCSSKMALVMLTFKMAEEYRDLGIKVNALQINGAKMSKETLNKVSPTWRWIARIQNLYFQPTEFMAKHYFELCTSNEFKDATGKLFNHKQEVMKRAEDKPSMKMQIKQATGSSYYPILAENPKEIEKLWNLCMDLTKRDGSEFRG